MSSTCDTERIYTTFYAGNECTGPQAVPTNKEEADYYDEYFFGKCSTFEVQGEKRGVICQPGAPPPTPGPPSDNPFGPDQPNEDKPTEEQPEESDSTGIIIGIICGVLVLFGLIGLVAYCKCKRDREITFASRMDSVGSEYNQ